MNHLVIAPHPDDEAIGLGGTICKLTDVGESVHVVFLTSGEKNGDAFLRELEARVASEHLGNTHTFLRFPDGECATHVDRLADAIRTLLLGRVYEQIFLPHPGEAHPDHAVSFAIVKEASARAGPGHCYIPVLGYEVWSPLVEFQFVSDVSEVMPRKLKAIQQYRTQLADLPFDKAAEGLARYRGCFAGKCEYAEVMCRLSLEEV